MYDVNLQPITSESNIPFRKVLLVSNGSTISTALLTGMNEDGRYVFKLTPDNIGVNGLPIPVTRELFIPTHYAILNITLNESR